jgi:tRNA-dihydrouridine synthase
MATLSHEALRRTIERFGGCDEYYTEMIHAPSLITGGKFEHWYLKTGPCPEKIVWQLTGGEPEPIAKAAEMVADIGGLGIDINMGCCAPEIRKQGAGISWMLKPIAETAALLREVRSVIDGNTRLAGSSPLRLSIKIRLGSDDFTEEGLLTFTRMAVDEGVTQIVLHPRTKSEKFRRTPRWEWVQRLSEELPIPVIGNGNITGITSASAAMSAAPDSAGIMIGRTAVSSPWIFRELKNGDREQNPERLDLLEIGTQFLDDLMVYQPQEFHKTRAQRFFSFFCDHLTYAQYLRVKIANAPSASEIRTIFSAYFDEVPENRFYSA